MLLSSSSLSSLLRYLFFEERLKDICYWKEILKKQIVERLPGIFKRKKEGG